MRLDALIFGGGAAGLWLLDELTRRGRSAVLLEAFALGSGQTVASQGIIHGGLKYALSGLLTKSAANIREMPLLWRDCLAGRSEPDLSAVRRRSDVCYLWRTDSVSSRLGMIGARVGLRVAAESLTPSERPPVLAGCPGTVARLEEQVIAPESFIRVLTERHRERILQIDPEDGLSFELDGPRGVRAVTVTHPRTAETQTLRPGWTVFTAGGGNGRLRERVGLTTDVVQRRPLHMVLLRGDLPELNGHCVDGAKTRVTITSDVDSAGRRIWQVGGQLAEDGVTTEAASLIDHAHAELTAAIPGLDLSAVEWTTYRVDRAEGRTATGLRPEGVQILRDGDTLTAWPTKLALAPRLAAELAEIIATRNPVSSETPGFRQCTPLSLQSWPRPPIARLPWETTLEWRTLTESQRQPRVA